ncbi:S8 family serine peptidase [Aquibacillus sp. 3ASR75-54]|uniref:S8 family serine peptidase n=2 Tax=Aquibacillus salsiterrae TaxID=2950439 RepID=A0A9X4AG50_9BACI|nr:S8 family serine peptidase [Aquibacillus salsiterrae]
MTQEIKTRRTGADVKVGVIDTGIDYTHPDLKNSFKGGYDLVDLDDDPMETQPDQGMPTLHGTHVSGIIAGNGNMQGVAKEADLYGYRALGPGGRGTSIQVIAAIEKAVKDGMDIINMSLGNTINGPDWPTSIAVSRAIELGTSVVIANGNAGPANWTVGSPATAPTAISVGASTPPLKTPYLYDSFAGKVMELAPFMGAKPWAFERKYPIVYAGLGTEEIPNVRGKIVVMKRGVIPFAEKARAAEAAGAEGVIIFNNEKGLVQGSVADDKGEIGIPVASISEADGKWLVEQAEKGTYWINTNYQQTQDDIASFSSRGPVTANWDIKPEIVAPGAAINSTVPGGYMELQGTSMAAPHVAGGLALVKQAHPDWTPAKLKGALLTTALPLKNGDEYYEPIEQGMGRMRIEKAIDTPVIIYNSLLSFGKITNLSETKTVTMTVENVSNKTQSFRFDIPKKQAGLSFQLPQAFTVGPNEKKQIPITLKVNDAFLNEGIHQGWLTLAGDNDTYQLPYMFINQEADYPKVMGVEFALKLFSDDEYRYRLYLPEKVEQVTVDLYDPNQMSFDRTLLELDEPGQGVIEGALAKREIGKRGLYLANVRVTTNEGDSFDYQMELTIQ